MIARIIINATNPPRIYDKIFIFNSPIAFIESVIIWIL
ncbi:hypothetical protein LEP1GSC074_3037 [Leptospira noguchii str. Hook]|nr:hypothetical protein LEP1GSC074_3037 [Leptospira noguchii str. Hook]